MKANIKRTRQKDVTLVMITAMCMALNAEYGFGGKRLDRVIRRFNEYCRDNLESYYTDDVTAEKVKRDFQQFGLKTIEWR